MNIEITGNLLERLETLCLAKGQQADIFAKEVLARGVETIESETLGANAKRARFIQKHWRTMTDKTMARRLGCKLGILARARKSLGFERRIVPDLDDNAKYFVANHPELSLLQCANLTNSGPESVLRYCRKLATAYIQVNGVTELDAEIGRRFHLNVTEIGSIRSILGLLRTRGSHGHNRKVVLADLGTKAELEFALRRGGKTLVDIVHEKRLPISRERARQLIAKYGLTSNSEERTASWYAYRCGHPEFVDKVCFETALKESGNIHKFSLSLSLDDRILHRIVDLHGINVPKTVPRIELVCSCGKKFFRRESLIKKQKKENPNRKFFCSVICRTKYVIPLALAARREKRLRAKIA